MKFEEYERVIMRYGYTGRITENIIEEIAQDINLDISHLEQENSIQHYFFKNGRVFQDGVFKPDQLLKIGYLLTIHDSPRLALESLWGLINPNMEEYVENNYIKSFLEDLFYYPVDLHLEYQLKTQHKNGEIEEYLRELDETKNNAINEIFWKLDAKVSKADFIDSCGNKLTASYKIRSLVQPIRNLE
ncbi:UNKNOWN [Stylonychia lemnae]|uniref:Uncharacterized protein n=1 Tax=Stylonychia lemnae TaxID=5949 RepID=A0A078AJ09_STYLE|nr:UNKNOWN [Stylonychia lemnae]|eukprot:CDW82315.1 UNKNOWN [Stylonychia lemnae]